jgi:hypothetical protein
MGERREKKETNQRRFSEFSVFVDFDLIKNHRSIASSSSSH